MDLADSDGTVFGMGGVDNITPDDIARVDGAESWVDCRIWWPHGGVIVVPDEAGEDQD